MAMVANKLHTIVPPNGENMYKNPIQMKNEQNSTKIAENRRDEHKKSSKKPFKNLKRPLLSVVAFVTLIRLIKNLRIMVLLNTIYDNGRTRCIYIKRFLV